MKSLVWVFLFVFGLGPEVKSAPTCRVKCTTFVNATNFGCSSKLEEYQYSVPPQPTEALYQECLDKITPHIKTNNQQFNGLVKKRAAANKRCPRGVGEWSEAKFGIQINSADCTEDSYIEDLNLDPQVILEADMIGDCRSANLAGEIRFGFRCRTSNKKIFTFYPGAWFTEDRRHWTPPTRVASLEQAELFCLQRGRRLPMQKELDTYRTAFQIDEIFAPKGESYWVSDGKPNDVKAAFKLATCLGLRN